MQKSDCYFINKFESNHLEVPRNEKCEGLKKPSKQN